MDINVITKDGQFDARKARQLLYEWSRDSRTVNQTSHLAQHLGLSSEETYLLMAVHLLSENQGLLRMVMDEVNTRIPTFRMQATQSGPFETKSERGGL